MAMFQKNRNNVGTTGASDSKFASVVSSSVKKSVFNRDQIHKTTFNAGKLIPIYLDEVLPGDTFNINLDYVCRMSTPIFPTMDDIDLDFYFFFVPNRLVWNGWQALHGENTTATPWVPSTQPSLAPIISSAKGSAVAVQAGSIGDYYGLQPQMSGDTLSTIGINALPFRGYRAIWNRWFRDQNLQAPLSINLTNGGDGDAYVGDLLSVNKKHDYFTSALPQPTKGLSDNAARVPFFLDSVLPFFGDISEFAPDGIARNVASGNSTSTVGDKFATGDGNTTNFIQTLRNAFQLNKLLERDARSGTRYVELLKAHFGVEAEDYRLQYPEFLGHHAGGINIAQVPQTSSTDDTSPQGNLAAYAVAAGHANGFTKSFVEHGYVHGFVVARQRKTYQQGLEKMWFRRDRFDYYYPGLAHISEQPILVKEIMATDGSYPDLENIFGFQEAWADYRYKPNRVSGQFRSNHSNSLDSWHYADYYEDIPYLSADWIKDNSAENIDRTLAVQSSANDQFLLNLKISNKSARPMPVYSIPMFADHF